MGKDMIESLDNFVDYWIGWFLRIGIIGLPIWFVYNVITLG